MPERKAAQNPKAQGRSATVRSALSVSSAVAAKIMGTDIKNEYSTAKEVEAPSNKEAHIVEPDRETPGRIATVCAKPRTTAKTQGLMGK